jgi:hypothetical protein
MYPDPENLPEDATIWGPEPNEKYRTTNEAHALWMQTIDKMIYAMELIKKYDHMYIDFDNPVFDENGNHVEIEELKQAAEEGWKLFHKYFFHLWD